MAFSFVIQYAAGVTCPPPTNIIGYDEMKQCYSDLTNLAVHRGLIQGELLIHKCF